MHTMDQLEDLLRTLSQLLLLFLNNKFDRLINVNLLTIKVWKLVYQETKTLIHMPSKSRVHT